MNNKKIIFATIIFLFISFVFLSIVEMKQADLNNKNIWMLYFSNPKGTSLDFVIENHSQNSAFHWEIAADKNKVEDGDINVPIGESKTILVSLEDVTNKKITIIVNTGDNKKEIYKSF